MWNKLDRNNECRTHWWSILNIYSSKRICLFHSLSFEGLKKFVIQDDQNLFNKILHGVNKFNKKDNIILLIF